MKVIAGITVVTAVVIFLLAHSGHRTAGAEARIVWARVQDGTWPATCSIAQGVSCR